MSDTPPDADGGEECFLKEATTSDEGCERHESCIVPRRVGDTRLGVVEPRYANCGRRSGGGSDCFCSTRSSIFGFLLSSQPTAETCEAAIRNCDPDAVIEPAGPVTCEPTSVDAPTSTGCQADLDCSRTTTVDGRQMVAKGRLLVTCGRVAEGSAWWCSCASDQKTMRFPLGAEDADPSQACGQAPAECIENLPVQFGPYGEFVPAPYPLP
jgi:hypothetical protein